MIRLPSFDKNATASTPWANGILQARKKESLTRKLKLKEFYCNDSSRHKQKRRNMETEQQKMADY